MSGYDNRTRETEPLIDKQDSPRTAEKEEKQLLSLSSSLSLHQDYHHPQQSLSLVSHEFLSIIRYQLLLYLDDEDVIFNLCQTCKHLNTFYDSYHLKRKIYINISVDRENYLCDTNHHHRLPVIIWAKIDSLSHC